MAVVTGIYAENATMVNFEEARRMMVDNQIHPNSVTDRAILKAMGQVPREKFVPEGRRSVAYSDTPHGFNDGRWLMAPSQFARLIQLANITPSDRVLDVGALSGYTSAVLARIGGEVVALELNEEFAGEANRLVGELGIDNVEVVCGPLPDGEFDVIVVEEPMEAEPSALFDSLAEGGRLVVIIQSGVTAVAHVYGRSGGTVSGRAEFNATALPSPDSSDLVQFQF